MKTRLIVLSICFSQCFLYAQEFSTKFYLTSKSGMTDSIELGYDNNASFGIDPQFSEIAYNSPLNTGRLKASIISCSKRNLGEVIHYNESIEGFSKKQIVPIQPNYWIEQNAIGIMIPNDSLPILFTWDKSQFTDEKRNYSIITDWPLGGWFDAGNGNTSFLKNLKDTGSVLVKDRLPNYIYSDGSNQYPMFVFFVAFANLDNIKADVRIINESNYFTVFPNCTSDFVYIKNNVSNQPINATIISLSGTIIGKFDKLQTKIDLSPYPSGIYFIRLESNQGKFNFKIIKK